MLDPHDRRVLLEALRPPDGFVVDRALATTYSLDLIALLVAPLAFSLYDHIVGRDDKAGSREAVDSFALLDAVRSHAERLFVFCDAGAIAKPTRYRQALTYLESSVIPVQAPAVDGVFHPKIWVQRFRSKAGNTIRYRLLCNSRNLTFDPSWDTMLVLDGELADRERAFSGNHPLGDFIAALPSLAPRKLPAAVTSAVESIANEIRRVRFDLPEHVETVRFWPLGHDGRHPWPFDERIDRLLVMSPFANEGTLKRLGDGRDNVFISRSAELATLSASALQSFPNVFALNDALDEDDDEDEDAPAHDLPMARGLHAKLYIADSGWNAHVWTGSANATTAGFERNVEFLVQLTGKKSQLGVDRALGVGDKTGLHTLLVPFTPTDDIEAVSEVERRLDDKVRAARRAVGRTPWVVQIAPASAAGPELYDATLSARGDGLLLPPGVTARCWPISLTEGHAVAVPNGARGAVTTFRCSFQALTPFIAFEIRATEQGQMLQTFAVVSAVLEGAPQDRQARVLQSLLENPSRVMRFLRLLLAVDSHDVLLEALEDFTDDEEGDGIAGGRGSARLEIPLLESLMRALEKDPARLVSVERLVRELRGTPEGTALLPPDFDLVWEPIWAAYQTLPHARRVRS